MKIALIFPTVTEAKYFKREGVNISFCGVGVIPAAYNTLKTIHSVQPDVVIMAGIAGVYPDSNLKIGDCVLISKERIADLGFFYEDGFREFESMKFDMSFEFTQEIDCPYIKEDMPLKTATSNSMNSAMSPYVKTKGVDTENMEGAAFFFVCKNEGVKFFEVRSISNVVDPKHEDWDYDGSIKNMSDGVNKLIDYLEHEVNN